MSLRIPQLQVSFGMIAFSFLYTGIGFAGCPALDVANTQSQVTLNVRDFGAVGNGQWDDRPAIQKALDCAKQLRNAVVSFGPGVYHILSSTSEDGQLLLENWDGPLSISLIGSNTILRSEHTDIPILMIAGNWQNSLVRGLTFQGRHTITTVRTRGLEIAGGAANGTRNFVIEQCTFQNFSRGITLSGTTGITISSNRFLMDKGRDSGTSTNMPEPNVGVWMMNNSPNGTVVDAEITSNVYDGCASGSLNWSVSRRCGDGLVFGKGSHVTVHDNSIKHFSFEAIYLDRNPKTGEQSALPSNIANNTIDGTIIPGDISGGGQWAIRADDDSVIVEDNLILNAVTGIMAFAMDMDSNIVNSIIRRNKMLICPGTGQFVHAGIVLSGVNGTIVDSNEISFCADAAPLNVEFYGVFISGYSPSARRAEWFTVTGNTITSATKTNATGVYLQWADQWSISGNTLSGLTQAFHLMNFGGSLPDISALTQGNILSQNNQVRLITN